MLRSALALLLLAAPAAFAAEVALVTALQGKVTRATLDGEMPVDAFVKLKHGDLLTLGKGASLQLAFFSTGRQETWSGSGKLDIGVGEGQSGNLPPPQLKTLPLVIVKQMARTPSAAGQGKAGAIRLRAVQLPATPDLAKLEENYRQMRGETDKADLNPDIYLLAGLFELKELDRLEKRIEELQQERAGDGQVKLLASLYRKAARNAREARGESRPENKGDSGFEPKGKALN